MDINNIAKIGDNLSNKQCNKAACFHAFKEALENDGKMTEIDMAMMYRYFMPNTPAKAKTAFQWVALAMGNKDVRYYLNYVYSDGVRLMATDGSRVHMIKSANMPAGYYDKNGVMVHGEEFAKFPDIDRVIPNNDKLTFLSELEQTILIDGKAPYNAVYDFDEIRVCKKYIDDAAQWFDSPLIKHKDKNTSMMFESLEAIAVIMPICKK